MINEDRVRLMTKMASFEQREGREYLKILEYYREDYVSRKMIRTWIYTTVSFLMLLGVYSFFYMNQIFRLIQEKETSMMLAKFIGVYLLYEIFFLIVSFVFYRRKYKKAIDNTKEYYKNLKRLERSYEKEQGGIGNDDNNVR